MSLATLLCMVFGHKRSALFRMPVVHYVCPRCWRVVPPRVKP